MNYIFKNVQILDPHSAHNKQQMDLEIINGIITKIAKKINTKADTEIIELPNAYISPSWVDAGVHYKDPGNEWQESLESLSNAAQKGGIGIIIGFPNTNPVIQNKESLAYFSQYSKNQTVQLLNLGAVTKNCEGNDFTDMLDLDQNGVCGFSDGVHSLQNTDLFLKTLQYLQHVDKVFVNKPIDTYLSMHGQMHEGLTSTMLGLKGIPSAAEEIAVAHHLNLLSYANIKSSKSILHFSTISCAESVELIRKAKKKGLAVSCDVAVHNLIFTDEVLMGFDTNFKVMPPLRSKKDQKALLDGLLDGTIDMIVSDHNPLDSEQKNLEFDLASFGVAGIQSLFSALNTYTKLPLETIIEKITLKPREIFRLKSVKFSEGEPANFTIFNTDSSLVLEKSMLASNSKNSPFIGKELNGKALGIFNNNIFTLN